MILASGQGPPTFTDAELAGVGSDFAEVPLDCLGVAPQEPWAAGKVDGDLAGFKSPADVTRAVTRARRLTKSTALPRNTRLPQRRAQVRWRSRGVGGPRVASPTPSTPATAPTHAPSSFPLSSTYRSHHASL